MENTENLNFGGGNTKWEERKLGPYATSETRLVEIIENICDKDGNSKKCHTMVENSEEYMEKWWKDIYAEGEENSQPLYDFLCINNLQVCCQKGKFGPKCKDCSGGSMNPCQGNGDCDGEGTRSGNGTCSCQEGYTGDTCTECVEGFYEVTPSNPKDSVKCKKCHESCESQCWEAGPKGCDECKAGYTQTEADGCVDVNECTENKHECSEDEYCSNSQGSYDCKECPSGCKGCTSFDECTECQEGYLQPEGSTVCADKNECEAEVCTGNNEKCYNTPGSYSCYCEDGYQRIDDECTEIIKNEEEEMIEMTGEINDEL
ncbi:hypothetical protein CAPTEDRAFT_152137 [Capitella teleta]|uniref:EGF-like domain-containing protein n=1 Tax=Capitella teleta TaxID=283909 RepID=R7V6B4_CAPTE|nr:hypothetical protein CAPTEDRAFT_152137 [Capitella teleta]|eukprot:ELU11891.1 hypothetical protein CAPTEDRAFT_152137 [Capitella teleta]